MNKTTIIYSELFKNFPEIVFGFSTKIGGVSPEPYCLNLSSLVGDDLKNVKRNRKIFFDEIGIKEEDVTFQKQIHSTIINYSVRPQHFDGGDAMYTDKKENFLAVGVADCIPIFLYDLQKQVCAAVHAGWRGTHGQLLSLTISELRKKFSINAANIIAFIGPSISQKHYEIGDEVAELFEEDLKFYKNPKYHLDLKKANYKQLINSGVKKENIEVSELCTFTEKDLLHSYRRDGNKSGRMFGILGMRE